jgi:serine/threonine protein kinase
MSEVLRGTGSTLGSYEILDEIGRGGLGIVYRGRHVHLGRLVALKVLHPLWTSTPEFVQRFRDEGRMMALLEHPNILRVYDAGESEGHFFLAMSHLEGQTLEEVMAQPVPLEQGLGYVRQIAGALAFAHRRGVIHRDVKPANVMVSPDGHVTLMDFGVARLKDAPGMTLPGIRVGTPYYMAPEQILGHRIDGRADIYALGVILHQLLSGRLPFPGPTTEEVFEGHMHREPPPLDLRIPEWLQCVVSRALAKDPEQRYPDAEGFYRALDAGLTPAAARGLSVTLPEGSSPAGGASGSTGPRSTTAATRENRAALSLDVVNSTRMKHPGLTQWVQEQFAQFRSYVRSHLEAYGCLESVWSGDGLLALFLRPAEAAACAAAILDGLVELNAGGGSEWAEMKVRIGVHHGPLLRAEETPLGEVVSRTLDGAGHLQKLAPENSALISENTYFGLKEQHRWAAAPAEYAVALGFPVYQYRLAPPPEPEPAPAPRSLRLEVESRGATRAFELDAEALIGRPDPASRRTPEIDLRNDDAVSRRHARIFPGEGGFYVEDLDSANGTMLNGRWLVPSTPARLHPGDAVEVGECTIIRVL